jgi:antitoxin component YwqK of YwqJK toxin-antitoxin module
VSQMFTYDNGQLHGEYVCFYQTGKIRWKCNYEKGKLHGDFIEYWFSGKVDKKRNYENGKLVEPVC